MLDIDELERLESEVSRDPALKVFVTDALAVARPAPAERGPNTQVTRTGIEVAALWSLGLATLLVLRRLGLFGGSRHAQATDTREAAEKLGEAVEVLRAKGFDKQQAMATVQTMYQHAAERADNVSLIAALVGKK